MAERRILFGGSFDPVHHGHLIVARSLAEQCGFTSLSLVPAASPPHKAAAHAPAEDRLAMLRLAIQGEPLLELCELEIHRPGPSYTFDTLAELRRVHGSGVELNWVIGADMLADLPRWHRATEILRIAKLIVVVRPPWHDRMEQDLRGLKKVFPADQLQLLRKSVWQTPLIDISSTEIRRRIGLGMTIKYLTTDAVVSYIQDRRLYLPR